MRTNCSKYILPRYSYHVQTFCGDAVRIGPAPFVGQPPIYVLYLDSLLLPDLCRMRPYFILAVAACLSAVLAQNPSTALTLETPGFITACESITMLYSGGTPPYSLSILCEVSEIGYFERIILVSAETARSYVWNVDLAPGTFVVLFLEDSTGDVVDPEFVVGTNATNL